MQAVVGVVSGHGLSIYVHSEDQPNKYKLTLYKPSIYFNSPLLKIAVHKVVRWNASVMKVGVA